MSLWTRSWRVKSNLLAYHPSSWWCYKARLQRGQQIIIFTEFRPHCDLQVFLNTTPAHNKAPTPSHQVGCKYCYGAQKILSRQNLLVRVHWQMYRTIQHSHLQLHYGEGGGRYIYIQRERDSITKSKHVLYWKYFTPKFRPWRLCHGLPGQLNWFLPVYWLSYYICCHIYMTAESHIHIRDQVYHHKTYSSLPWTSAPYLEPPLT